MNIINLLFALSAVNAYAINNNCTSTTSMYVVPEETVTPLGIPTSTDCSTSTYVPPEPTESVDVFSAPGYVPPEPTESVEVFSEPVYTSPEPTESVDVFSAPGYVPPEPTESVEVLSTPDECVEDSDVTTASSTEEPLYDTSSLLAENSASTFKLTAVFATLIVMLFV